MRIALDAMGGDHAPGPNIDGALAAIQRHDDIEIALVGDRAVLEEALENQSGPTDRVSVVESVGFVGMHEKPTVALREKPDCSIVRCWQLMANRDVDAVVSAGNTGAVVAAGLRTRLFLRGIKRPGIAVTLPTLKGSSVLLDVGANPAARPEHLYQYAVMGRVYAHEMLGIENPRIGLMNIGSEDGKGNDLYRETHSILSECGLRGSYIGNVEGRGLYQGEADVLVCEGFVGNVVLKVSEGMAEYLMKTVGSALMGALDQEKDLAAQTMHQVAAQYRYQEAGGAPLLGIDGTCVICHGSSDADSIRNALGMARRMKNMRMNATISETLAELTASRA